MIPHKSATFGFCSLEKEIPQYNEYLALKADSIPRCASMFLHLNVVPMKVLNRKSLGRRAGQARTG
jgi:hypothetical protein